MNLAIKILIFFLFVYTAGFSVTLWKQKNKPGSFAVFFLAATIAILPFFTIFK